MYSQPSALSLFLSPMCPKFSNHNVKAWWTSSSILPSLGKRGHHARTQHSKRSLTYVLNSGRWMLDLQDPTVLLCWPRPYHALVTAFWHSKLGLDFLLSTIAKYLAYWVCFLVKRYPCISMWPGAFASFMIRRDLLKFNTMSTGNLLSIPIKKTSSVSVSNNSMSSANTGRGFFNLLVMSFTCVRLLGHPDL